METRLRNFTYDVDINPVKINIVDDDVIKRSESDKISVITTNIVEAECECTRITSENNVNKILPYGIKSDSKGEIEIKDKVKQDVIENTVRKNITKATKKK